MNAVGVLIKYEASGNVVYSVWEQPDGEIRNVVEVEIEHDGSAIGYGWATNMARQNAEAMNRYIEAEK